MDPNSSGGLSSSGGSELDEYPVALAALILAAGAFIVALAQAFMQYLSSSEARGKCTYEAIDMSAKSTKLRWNWTFWKLRVYYPVLDISFDSVMEAARNQAHHRIDGHRSPIMWLTVLSRNPKLEMCSFTVHQGKESNDSLLTVSDGYTTLVERGSRRAITSKSLTWAETATLVWWKLTHNAGPVNRPRASWAQMLMAFGIRDTSPLVYRHADADSIPTSVDAPIQRINLFDLGKLAFSLGFKTVTINAQSRDFYAAGEHGTITTLMTNELGKVIRFDGDILAIYAQFDNMKAGTDPYNSLILGRLSFAPGISTNGLICPLQLLEGTVAQRWDQDQFRSAERHYFDRVQEEDGLIKGQVVAEAFMFETLYKSHNGQSLRTLAEPEATPGGTIPQHTPLVDADQGSWYDVLQNTMTGSDGSHTTRDDTDVNPEYHALPITIRRWTRSTGLRLPTVIPATSLCLLPGSEAGYPSSALIEPVMPWIQSLANQVKGPSEGFALVSRRMTAYFKTYGLSFADPRDQFRYSRGGIGRCMEERFPLYGWILEETRDLYRFLPTRDQDDVILRGPDGNYTGDVQPVILTECYMLLQDFRPRSWASRIERIVAMQLQKFRPHNMVWAQVLLLDIAIHFLVRGGFHPYDRQDRGDYDLWSKEVVAVFKAIVYSWDPSVESSRTSTDTTRSVPSTPEASASPHRAQTAEGSAKEHEMTAIIASVEPAVRQATAWTTTDNTNPATTQFTPEQHPSPTSTEPPNNPPSADPKNTFPDVAWDLAGSLRKQAVLFASCDLAEREAKVQKLACLLQLRALFVIALFTLMPDSSDVYLTDGPGKRVEMPMI